MNAFEFLNELIEKSEWHKIVITDAGLAGKMVEFAELYHASKIKEMNTQIPDLFLDLIDEKEKELVYEIENENQNPMREYNLGVQLSNLCEARQKIWLGYFNCQPN